MKTYRERTDDILARAEGMRKRSRRNTLISVLAVCLAALCGLLLLLFVPYANTEMPTLAEYRGSEYYPLMQKINTLTYRAPKYKNNFEALAGWLQNLLGGYGAAGDAEAPNDNADEGDDYFEVTDNQVAGVVEGDLFKATESTLFYLTWEGGCYILRACSAAGADSAVLAEYTIPADEGARTGGYTDRAEIYLSGDGDTVTLFSPAYVQSEGQLYTQITSIDVSDPAAMQLTDRVYVSGSYISSRKTDGTFLLISHFAVRNNPDFADEAQYLPQVGTPGDMHSLPMEDIVLPDGADTARYTVVCSLAEEGLAVEDAYAFFSYTDTVYVSENNIFVARSHDLAGQVIACGAEGSCSYSEERTEIACLAYEGGAFTYRGTADVPGTVKDQYSLDERNGQLRVVTTLYRWGLQTEGTVSDLPPLGTNAGVYIVGLADFQTVGALEWFAPQGERVMSARFEKEEDLVWVCTAVEFTDPVFRIDLSDPANLTYTETGTVEGYSHTLIDFTDGTLLGIGYGESTWELKIELYEKQGGEVVSLDAYTADETISTDYKAYFIDRENGLVGMQVYNGGESEYLVLAYDGYGLTEALRLPMADGDYDYTRAAYIGGWLYILSDDETGFYAVQL